jgi:formylglycine-generating enzyme required for sulfatase activity
MTMPLTTGQILRERYRIVKLLGQGGFGEVYRAWDTTFEVACAVKENSEASPEAQRQFTREARLLHTLRHPNLPLVKDYFVIEGQGQYLVMDFVEGEDLQEKLDTSGGPLPEEQVVAWILQVCAALEYLHTQIPPVIHRDIKPANIKITPEGRAVLVDFGIAKQSDPGHPTTRGAQAATPGYAPFEQYGQATTDARSDLYSLGATLYHLLTGKIPVESISRMRGVTLENPRTLNPILSQRVERAILQAMALQPEGRYQTTRELEADLHIPPTERINPRLSGETQLYTKPSTPAVKIARRSWLSMPGLYTILVLVGLTLSVIVWITIGLNKRLNERVAIDKYSTQAVGEIQTERAVASNTVASDILIASTIMVKRVPEGMALIPTGEFQMGSNADTSLAECQKYLSDCTLDWFSNEEPVHTVNLDAYYIDKYEVTNTRYAECVAVGKCSTPQDTTYYNNSDYAQHPVVNVDWNQARIYCQWRGGDLLTEAQWEKAARGGLVGKLYPWGDDPPVCTKGAENGAQYSGCGDQTAAVGGFRPNGYGLFDMAGNVWEWVLDWYLDPFYDSSPYKNPSGPSSGEYRTLRGGSWSSNVNFLRVANRFSRAPDDKNIYIGFRCAQSP